MIKVALFSAAALITAGMLGRVGERLIDWLLPSRLNYRLALLLAKLSALLALSARTREEARDALANVLADGADGDIRPLAAVLPVAARTAVGLPLFLLAKAALVAFLLIGPLVAVGEGMQATAALGGNGFWSGIGSGILAGAVAVAVGGAAAAAVLIAARFGKVWVCRELAFCLLFVAPCAGVFSLIGMGLSGQLVVNALLLLSMVVWHANWPTARKLLRGHR